MFNLKKTPIIFMLVLSVLSFSSNAHAFDGTVDGGTMAKTKTGVRIDGPGNVEFKGDVSTPAGFTVDIYAINALLRDTTGVVTIANGIYTLYGPGTLGMINSAGIIFGSTAQVHAANIIVSTLNISSPDFFEGCRTGTFRFTGQGAYIINHGRLIPQPGGYVCLLSQAINNTGTIQAALGKIILASGEKMTLALDDLGTISVVVDDAVKSEIFGPDGQKMKSAIENSGTITANGGKVTLTAKSLNKVFDYAINNTGIIEAKSLNGKGGEVELIAPDGAIGSVGTLRASFLFERGASFRLGGVCDITRSDIENADGAVTLGTGYYTGTYWDTKDINISPNSTITLTGDTIFYADSDHDGTGSFNMDMTSTVVGNNHDLSIFASQNSSVGLSLGINTFSTGCSDPSASVSFSINALQCNTFSTGANPPAIINHNMPAPVTAPATAPGMPSTASELLQSESGNSKIIYETLKNYRFSTNTLVEPLFYFYHPLTPIDQGAFDNINLDTGAYEFINNSLDLKKHPATYYGL